MDQNSFKLCEADLFRKSGKSSRHTVKSLLPLWDGRPAETTRRLIPVCAGPCQTLQTVFLLVLVAFSEFGLMAMDVGEDEAIHYLLRNADEFLTCIKMLI
ncbi:hypothetical protein CDAR_280261 [Caerostris darwini]|uniref:Uncharacterized protein n=1 Tax=Caerostris darwini TaxID=1538125 RepID=A0AAV4SDV1_9ARAC|nr:hypothetical protein CDAR_280261 [Caerostris darwini]